MRRIVVLAVVMAALSGCGAVETAPPPAPLCAGQPFGVEKRGAGLTPVATAPNPYLPPEIGGIRHGTYFESGSFISPGASWIGLDLDAGQVIQVQRYAGFLLSRVPQIETPTADRFARPGKTDRLEWVDVITRVQPSAAELDATVCTANQLWLDTETVNRTMVTDIVQKFVLIDGGQIKHFGGVGLIPPRTNLFAKRLYAMAASPAKP